VRSVGIITGLQSEADCLRNIASELDLRILVSGVSPMRAEALARQLGESRCDLLLSFGIAGALRPGIKTGDLLVPALIKRKGGSSYETDAGIRTRLLQAARAALPELAVLDDALLGTDTLISGEIEKLSAGDKYAAAAADMESHSIAIAAEAHGLPLIAVRAVLDDFGTELPGFVNDWVTPEGKPDYAKVLASAVMRPANIPKMVGLAGISRIAHRSLRRVAPLISRVLNA
jgi:hypothetical protein